MFEFYCNENLRWEILYGFGPLILHVLWNQHWSMRIVIKYVNKFLQSFSITQNIGGVNNQTRAIRVKNIKLHVCQLINSCQADAILPLVLKSGRERNNHRHHHHEQQQQRQQQQQQLDIAYLNGNAVALWKKIPASKSSFSTRWNHFLSYHDKVDTFLMALFTTI